MATMCYHKTHCAASVSKWIAHTENWNGTLIHRQALPTTGWWCRDITLGDFAERSPSINITENNLPTVWKSLNRIDYQVSIADVPILIINVSERSHFDGCLSRGDKAEVIEFHRKLDDILSKRHSEPLGDVFSAGFLRRSHSAAESLMSHIATIDHNLQKTIVDPCIDETRTEAITCKEQNPNHEDDVAYLHHEYGYAESHTQPIVVNTLKDRPNGYDKRNERIKRMESFYCLERRRFLE